MDLKQWSQRLNCLTILDIEYAEPNKPTQQDSCKIL